MGAAQSENIAEENLSSIASVINEAVQNCSQTLGVSDIQNIDLSGFVGQNVTLSQTETILLKEGCLQSEAATSQLDAALQAAASQTANAISQQLDLSTSKSKNVIKINAQMATEIKNKFVQDCSNTVSTTAVQNVNATNARIGTLVLDQKSYINDLVSCSTSGNINDSLRTNLEATISQEATSKIESYFAPFLIALAVIIGIIALFLFLPALFRGRSAASDRKNNDDGLEGAFLAAAGEGDDSAGPGNGTTGDVLQKVQGILGGNQGKGSVAESLEKEIKTVGEGAL